MTAVAWETPTASRPTQMYAESTKAQMKEITPWSTLGGRGGCGIGLDPNEPSRRQTMEIAREERRLADVRRPRQLGDPPLEADRETAVRRHPVAERLQVALVPLGPLAARRERPQ